MVDALGLELRTRWLRVRGRVWAFKPDLQPLAPTDQ